DEIGMGDDLSLNERDSVRTPMQWSDEPQAGFSMAKKTILPVIDKDVWSYKRVNVEAQKCDPTSLLNWTERIIRARKEVPEFGWGDYRIVNTHKNSVLGLRYDWRNNELLTLHNFDDRPQSVTIELRGEGGNRLVNLLAADHSDADSNGKHRIVLEAYGYRWY